MIESLSGNDTILFSSVSSNSSNSNKLEAPQWYQLWNAKNLRQQHITVLQLGKLSFKRLVWSSTHLLLEKDSDFGARFVKPCLINNLFSWVWKISETRHCFNCISVYKKCGIACKIIVPISEFCKIRGLISSKHLIFNEHRFMLIYKP